MEWVVESIERYNQNGSHGNSYWGGKTWVKMDQAKVYPYASNAQKDTHGMSGVRIVQLHREESGSMWVSRRHLRTL